MAMDLNALLSLLKQNQGNPIEQQAQQTTMNNPSRFNLDAFKGEITQVGTRDDGTPIYGKYKYTPEMLQAFNNPWSESVASGKGRAQLFNSIERIGSADELLAILGGASTNGSASGNMSGSAGRGQEKASESRSRQGLEGGNMALAQAYLASLLAQPDVATSRSSGGMTMAQLSALTGGQSTTLPAGTGTSQDEVGRLLADYTKGAATTDSDLLMAKQRREALAKVMPGITTAMEGAGTQWSSMNAILQQQAAERAAEDAAALGAKQAVQYGDISQRLLASKMGYEGQVASQRAGEIAKMFNLLQTQESRSDSWHASKAPTGSVGGSVGGRSPTSTPTGRTASFEQIKKETPEEAIAMGGSKYWENRAAEDLAREKKYYPWRFMTEQQQEQNQQLMREEYIQNWTPSSGSGSGSFTNNLTGDTTLVGR